MGKRRKLMQSKGCLLDTEVVRCLMSRDGSPHSEHKEVFLGLMQRVDTCVSPVTIGEVQRLRWFREIRGDLAEQTLIFVDSLPCLDLTRRTARFYAKLVWRKVKTGLPQQNNRWQVALAQSNKMSLATLDEEIIKQAGGVRGVTLVAPATLLPEQLRGRPGRLRSRNPLRRFSWRSSHSPHNRRKTGLVE